MVKKKMKSCSTSLTIMETHVKIKMRYYLTFVRMTTIKINNPSPKITKVNEELKTL